LNRAAPPYSGFRRPTWLTIIPFPNGNLTMNSITHFFRQLSPKDFAAFGLNDLAYVKPIEVEGRPRFAIHAADGTALSVVPDRAVADAAVRQHEMEPLSVH